MDGARGPCVGSDNRRHGSRNEPTNGNRRRQRDNRDDAIRDRLSIRVGQSFLAIRRGQIALHREWMIRAFAIGSAVAAVRPIVGIFLATRKLTHLTPHDFFGTAFWLGFTIQLMAAEIWISYTRPEIAMALSGERAIDVAAQVSGSINRDRFGPLAPAATWTSTQDGLRPAGSSPVRPSCVCSSVAGDRRRPKACLA